MCHQLPMTCNSSSTLFDKLADKVSKVKQFMLWNSNMNGFIGFYSYGKWCVRVQICVIKSIKNLLKDMKILETLFYVKIISSWTILQYTLCFTVERLASLLFFYQQFVQDWHLTVFSWQTYIQTCQIVWWQKIKITLILFIFIFII